MYDFETSDTDYSYEYSDMEYETIKPYDYDLNSFKNENKVEETLEDKLLLAIDNGDLATIKQIFPELLKSQEEVITCNGDTNVAANGDVVSENSGEEDSVNSDNENFKDEEEDEEDIFQQHINNSKKEILLKNGETPLMTAAASARADIVEYILSLGMDVNYKLTNTNNCAVLSLTSNISVGWRYMNNSWRMEAPKVLKMLIDAGANVKVKGYMTTTETGYTALHYAAQSNYWELLELLIHAGADVDAMSGQKETALMLAASNGFVSCCNILLLAGANADLNDKSGSNAAYLASVEGHKTLSDAINVYSGAAQHNMELYKIWSQYQQENDNVEVNINSLDNVDSLSNSCIASFCLSIDVPDLIPVLNNQGVTIGDLKLMSISKLREIGVSEEDCDKVVSALQDMHRQTTRKGSNISFEYSKPLKLVTMLEMAGNMAEHVEMLDGNLECWQGQLSRGCGGGPAVHKAVVGRLREAAGRCQAGVATLRGRLGALAALCGPPGANQAAPERPETVPASPRSSRQVAVPLATVAATASVVLVAMVVARRLRLI